MTNCSKNIFRLIFTFHLWDVNQWRHDHKPTPLLLNVLNLIKVFISKSTQMVMSSSESSSPDATSPRPCTDTALSVLVKGLPEMLLRQFEYEDPIVRGGKHLLHSAFFKELVALACDLGLDSLPCCSETYKWAWFRRYCMASRVADAIIKRTVLPLVSFPTDNKFWVLV